MGFGPLFFNKTTTPPPSKTPLPCPVDSTENKDQAKKSASLARFKLVNLAIDAQRHLNTFSETKGDSKPAKELLNKSLDKLTQAIQEAFKDGNFALAILGLDRLTSLKDGNRKNADAKASYLGSHLEKLIQRDFIKSLLGCASKDQKAVLHKALGRIAGWIPGDGQNIPSSNKVAFEFLKDAFLKQKTANIGAILGEVAANGPQDIANSAWDLINLRNLPPGTATGYLEDASIAGLVAYAESNGITNDKGKAVLKKIKDAAKNNPYALRGLATLPINQLSINQVCAGIKSKDPKVQAAALEAANTFVVRFKEGQEDYAKMLFTYLKASTIYPQNKILHASIFANVAIFYPERVSQKGTETAVKFYLLLRPDEIIPPKISLKPVSRDPFVAIFTRKELSSDESEGDLKEIKKALVTSLANEILEPGFKPQKTTSFKEVCHKFKALFIYAKLKDGTLDLLRDGLQIFRENAVKSNLPTDEIDVLIGQVGARIKSLKEDNTK